MSYSLRSFKGGCIIAIIFRLATGDTRSLDYGSYEAVCHPSFQLVVDVPCHLILHFIAISRPHTLPGGEEITFSYSLP